MISCMGLQRISLGTKACVCVGGGGGKGLYTGYTVGTMWGCSRRRTITSVVRNRVLDSRIVITVSEQD